MFKPSMLAAIIRHPRETRLPDRANKKMTFLTRALVNATLIFAAAISVVDAGWAQVNCAGPNWHWSGGQCIDASGYWYLGPDNQPHQIGATSPRAPFIVQDVPVIYGRDPTPAERDGILAYCSNWADQQLQAQFVAAIGNIFSSSTHIVQAASKQQFITACWREHVIH